MIYMIKYHPYKSDKPNKNMVLLVTLILQFIKMKQEN
jgi:hypothetical protein